MKNKVTAAVLAFFFGWIGGHRFYLGQGGMGLMYLLFSWTSIPFWISMLDALIFLTMSDETFNLKYNPAFVARGQQQQQQQQQQQSQQVIVNLPPQNWQQQYPQAYQQPQQIPTQQPVQPLQQPMQQPMQQPTQEVPQVQRPEVPTQPEQKQEDTQNKSSFDAPYIREV